MTDPVFALEPDMPRNARVARWLLFRLLNGLRVGSLTVREGANLPFWRHCRRVARRGADPFPGRLLAFTDWR